jgi:hypothetical protein
MASFKAVEQFGKRIFQWASDNKLKTTVGTGIGATLIGAGHDMFGKDDILPILNPGQITAQFPTDASGGDFWTEMSFYSWKSSKALAAADLEVNTQSSTVKTDFLGIVRLPMPLQLATAYAGRYTEADDMHVNRDGTAWDVIEKAQGIGGGFLVETKAAYEALGNLNNTAKMASASINNNSMGMAYEGGTLRGHTFSWRLSAKNKEETVEIQRVIMILKGMSLPANNWNGAEDFDQFIATADGLANLGAGDDAMTSAAASAKAGGASVLAGGRLTIPPTVSVRFLDGGDTNPHLFKVKDSFITNVEVNYTSQGTWNPHKDGAPMEVQISITMKEVRQITRQDVMRGY